MRFVPLSLALGQPRCRHAWKAGGRQALKIYALVDGRDMRVRYVGKTHLEVNQRLAWHRKQPTNATMGAWLKGCRDARAYVLEYVSKEEWESAERGWIEWFRQRGDLLNVDMGGICRTSDGRPLKIQIGEFQPPVGRPRSQGSVRDEQHDPATRGGKPCPTRHDGPGAAGGSAELSRGAGLVIRRNRTRRDGQ